MDRERFDDAVERVEEIDRVVRKLDPAIRGHAFSVLAGYAVGPGASALAIEELVQLVLTLVAQEAENDLREIMQEVERVNAQKKRLRELVERLRQEESDEIARLRSEYDDLLEASELSELARMRLQMAMDRLSRMLSMLSNILKKLSDTQSSIIGNLK